jgi:hypothetical protein
MAAVMVDMAATLVLLNLSNWVDDLDNVETRNARDRSNDEGDMARRLQSQETCELDVTNSCIITASMNWRDWCWDCGAQ